MADPLQQEDAARSDVRVGAAGHFRSAFNSRHFRCIAPTDAICQQRRFCDGRGNAVHLSAPGAVLHDVAHQVVYVVLKSRMSP